MLEGVKPAGDAGRRHRMWKSFPTKPSSQELSYLKRPYRSPDNPITAHRMTTPIGMMAVRHLGTEGGNFGDSGYE